MPRSTFHSLLQRFARGDWTPEADDIERFLVMKQREVSPAVDEKLQEIIDTVPHSQ